MNFDQPALNTNQIIEAQEKKILSDSLTLLDNYFVEITSKLLMLRQINGVQLTENSKNQVIELIQSIVKLNTFVQSSNLPLYFYQSLYKRIMTLAYVGERSKNSFMRTEPVDNNDIESLMKISNEVLNGMKDDLLEKYGVPRQIVEVDSFRIFLEEQVRNLSFAVLHNKTTEIQNIISEIYKYSNLFTQYSPGLNVNGQFTNSALRLAQFHNLILDSQPGYSNKFINEFNINQSQANSLSTVLTFLKEIEVLIKNNRVTTI